METEALQQTSEESQEGESGVEVGKVLRQRGFVGAGAAAEEAIFSFLSGYCCFWFGCGGGRVAVVVVEKREAGLGRVEDVEGVGCREEGGEAEEGEEAGRGGGRGGGGCGEEEGEEEGDGGEWREGGEEAVGGFVAGGVLEGEGCYEGFLVCFAVVSWLLFVSRRDRGGGCGVLGAPCSSKTWEEGLSSSSSEG